MFDRSSLIRELKKEFPELTPKLNAEQGLLHFEVGAFYLFTQSFINVGDKDKVSRCFAIADRYLLNGDAKVRNAIATSYAECFEFEDTETSNRQWAWSIFPESLKSEYRIVRGEFGI